MKTSNRSAISDPWISPSSTGRGHAGEERVEDERAGVGLDQAVGHGRLQLAQAPVAEDEVQEPLGGKADVGGRRIVGPRSVGHDSLEAALLEAEPKRPGVQVDDDLAGVADRGRPRQPVLQHGPHRGEGAGRIGHADVEAVAAGATARQPGGGAAAGRMAVGYEEPDAPSRAVGVAPGPGVEVDEDGGRRRQPALARRQLEGPDRGAAVAEHRGVGHEADRNASRRGRPLDDEEFPTRERAGAVGQLVAPGGLVPHTAQSVPQPVGVDPGQERQVGEGRGAQRDLGRRVGNLGRRPPDRHRREVEGVGVAELAVVPGDPPDHLPEVADGLTPTVDLGELLPDEAPPPVGRVGGHQLRLSDGDHDARVRPVLRDQQHRRDDAAGGGVLDDHDVVLGPEPAAAGSRRAPASTRARGRRAGRLRLASRR